MSFHEQFSRRDTEELLGYLRLDLASEAKPVLLRVLAARGVSPETIEAIVAEEFAQVQAARAQQERLAGIGARLVAFAIDLGVALLAAFVLRTWVVQPGQFGAEALAIILCWSYFLFRDAIPGQSLGKRLLGLRVVRTADEREIGLLRSFLRNLPVLLFTVIDAIFVSGDRRMRLGDMLARTKVLRAAAIAADTPPEAVPPAQ